LILSTCGDLTIHGEIGKELFDIGVPQFFWVDPMAKFRPLANLGSHCGQLGGGLIGSGIAMGIGFGILIIFPALCKRHPASRPGAFAICTGIVAIGAASALGESLIDGRSGAWIGFAIGFGVVMIAVRCLWKFQQSAARAKQE